MSNEGLEPQQKAGPEGGRNQSFALMVEEEGASPKRSLAPPLTSFRGARSLRRTTSCLRAFSSGFRRFFRDIGSTSG